MALAAVPVDVVVCVVAWWSLMLWVFRVAGGRVGVGVVVHNAIESV